MSSETNNAKLRYPPTTAISNTTPKLMPCIELTVRIYADTKVVVTLSNKNIKNFLKVFIKTIIAEPEKFAFCNRDVGLYHKL